MTNMTTHSKNSLFLMELVLALLFLALCSAATIRLFSAAYLDRTKAREMNHIQELITITGETLEGTSRSEETSALMQLLPGGEADGENLVWQYDSRWKPAEDSSTAYRMEFVPAGAEDHKGGTLRFYKGEEELYTQQFAFPEPGPAEGGTMS